MLRELMEFYEPEKILHREKQMDEIRRIFKNFQQFKYGSNAFILGVTGSGKTTVTMKIVNEENNHLFVSVADTKTSYKALKTLFDLSYNTQEKIVSEAIRKLKRDPKILVIDEVNKCRDPQNLFNDLNTIYRQTGCPIIIISNKRTLIDEMPEDAKKTLMFDKIDFPSYNPLELFDIVKARLKAVKDRELPKIQDGALRQICAIGGREGSARIVLTITLKCIMNNDFSDESIRKQWANLHQEDWQDFVKNLNDTERRFLSILLNIVASKGTASHSDIIKHIPNLSPGRISQLITAFSDYGIIVTEKKNLGRRGGSFRIIKFTSQEVYDRLDKIVGIEL